MAQPTRLYVHATDPEPGAWCATCALPSAYGVTLTEVDESGVTPIGDVAYCPTCQQWTKT